MKTLEDFRLIRLFLAAEGITPTIAMVALPASEWTDLVLLAQEWQQANEDAESAKKAELASMDEADREMAEKARAEMQRREEEQLLYHSSGFRPGRHHE